jgi:surface carbohydrate biosynthesis protein
MRFNLTKPVLVEERKKVKPVVVIHVDAFRREYVSDWLLGQKFKRAGYRVIITSRTSTPYIFRVFTPDIVILSHVFSLSSRELTAMIRRNVRVYTNEVEGVIDDIAGIASTYPEGYIDYSLFSGIFVWSQWSRDWLIKHRNIDSQRVLATGSIRNSIVAKCRDVNHKTVIGILSRFELVNGFDGRHQFENLLLTDAEDESTRYYYDRCAIDAEAFCIVAKIIGILISKDIQVSIRPHPNENVSNYRLLKSKFGPLLSIDASDDLVEWLGKVSVVVGPVSTAYTEVYLSGIPIVSTEGIQRCHYSGADRIKSIEEFSRAAHMPKSVSDAVALCINPSLQPIKSSELDDYFDRFYTIEKKTDPTDDIVDFVLRNEVPGNFPWRRVPRSLGPLIKYCIDVASLCRAALTRRPLMSLRNMYQYNFNAVLHSPSAYMKRLDHDSSV